MHISSVGATSFHGFVIGVDEAGRGPLAGPVVAAAVVLVPLFIRFRLGAVLGAFMGSDQWRLLFAIGVLPSLLVLLVSKLVLKNLLLKNLLLTLVLHSLVMYL